MDEKPDWEIKPGELKPQTLMLLKAFFAIGISLPILLAGYGLTSYFFLGIR